MKFDKEGNLKLNWLERKIVNPMAGYVLLFSSAFGTAYFYYVNQFLPTAFSAGIVRSWFIPMLVGSAIGLTIGKYMEVRCQWKIKQRLRRLEKILKK